jgi:hypothetical protein
MGTQPKKFAKPAVTDVYGFLRRRDALIIHFSGPKGSEARPERMFPADLRNVVAGGAMGGLSCCVMGARDNFEKHSWGSIGVVLGFKNKDSLVAANPHDCGSMDDMIDGKIVRTVHREKDLSVTDLESTMDKRMSHNEWVVRDYVVLASSRIRLALLTKWPVRPAKFILKNCWSSFTSNQSLASRMAPSIGFGPDRFGPSSTPTFISCRSRCPSFDMGPGEHRWRVGFGQNPLTCSCEPSSVHIARSPGGLPSNVPAFLRKHCPFSTAAQST